MTTAKANILDRQDFIVASKNELQTKLNSVTASKDTLQTGLNSITASNNRLQTELDSITASKDELQTEFDSLTVASTDLTQQLESLTTANNNAGNELQSFPTDTQKQIGELKILKVHYAQREAQLRSKQSEVNELRSKTNALTSQQTHQLQRLRQILADQRSKAQAGEQELFTDREIHEQDLAAAAADLSSVRQVRVQVIQ